MHGGQVLSVIRHELEGAGYLTDVLVMRAEEYGVPQRRRRVLIVGRRPHLPALEPPPPMTRFDTAQLALDPVPMVYSASEALGDLPPLVPGQDGTTLDYVSEPQNSFQEFVRGRLTPDVLVGRLLSGRR